MDVVLDTAKGHQQSLDVRVIAETVRDRLSVTVSGEKFTYQNLPRCSVNGNRAAAVSSICVSLTVSAYGRDFFGSFTT